MVAKEQRFHHKGLKRV